jgi:hypothetical protein
MKYQCILLCNNGADRCIVARCPVLGTYLRVFLFRNTYYSLSSYLHDLPLLYEKEFGPVWDFAVKSVQQINCF